MYAAACVCRVQSYNIDLQPRRRLYAFFIASLCWQTYKWRQVDFFCMSNFAYACVYVPPLPSPLLASPLLRTSLALCPVKRGGGRGRRRRGSGGCYRLVLGSCQLPSHPIPQTRRVSRFIDLVDSPPPGPITAPFTSRLQVKEIILPLFRTRMDVTAFIV